MRRTLPPPLPALGDATTRRAKLASLLLAKVSRTPLLVLRGPAGSGKTTLLREVAERSRGEIPYVDLEGVRSEEEVAGRLRDALGAAIDAPLAALFDGWHRRTFALDHVEGEHALAAVDKGIARGVAFVVASREVFGDERAEEIEVGPLERSESIALLRSHVETSATDEELAPLFERVGDLALGVVILASWLRTFDPLELGRSFTLDLPAQDDSTGPSGSPPRHSSLETAIGWSWTRLDEETRGALLALAPFRRGGSVRAIERVLGRPPLPILEVLRKRSLGVFERGRFRLFRAVEDYARARAAEVTGSETVPLPYARAVLDDFVELRGRRVLPPADLEWLSLERENLSTIAEHFETRDPALHAEARLLLHPLLTKRGPLPEHARYLEKTVALLPEGHPLVRELHLARGDAARLMGRTESALLAATLAKKGGTGSDDASREADRLLAWAARTEGRFVDAEAILERAMPRAAGDIDERHGPLLLDLGFVRLRRGKVEAARDAFEHALDLFRAAKSDADVGTALSHLGVTHQRLGAVAKARECHVEALAIHRAHGNDRFVGADRMHLGYVAVDLGEHALAGEEFGAAEEALRRVGDRPLLTLVLLGRVRLELDRGRTEEARSALARAGRQLAEWSSRPGALEAEVARLLGHLAMSVGDRERAAIEYTAAAQLEQHQHDGIPASALLAYTESRNGAPPRANAFPTSPHPLEELAIRRLEAATTGHATRGATPAERALSFELRLVERWLDNGGPSELILGPEGQWFTLDGKRVDLARRTSIRRILLALVAHRQRGESLSLEKLVKAGWPTERILPDAAKQRAYTAVWTLRSLGLEAWITSDQEGYRLRPELVVREAS